jgi:iron complex outermembrane recepter protein
MHKLRDHCPQAAVLAASLLASVPALAQDPVQRVEITGSNLRRTDAETASPVQVITSADLVRSGYTSVSEVLREITANGQGTLSQSFPGAFAAGASGLSLRGLTVGATLVLIDGRRMAPYPLSDDGQRPFVDISSIPFAAVERVEILKDGASAIYGSDAIAGVVNVILKKQVSGSVLSADLGGSQHGGGATARASLMQGFGTEALNGYVALEYRKQDEIRLNQRSGDWTRFDWRPEGGEDLRPGVVNSQAALPRLPTPYLLVPGSATTNPANFAFYAGCDFAALAASRCVYENTWAQLQPKTQNLNLIGKLNARLSSDWDFNLTASFFDSKAQQTPQPQAVPFITFAGVTAIGPGITPRIVGSNLPFTVPASYPGNTLGVAAGVRALADAAAPRFVDLDSKATRLVAEVSGSAAGWDLNAALGLTRVKTQQTFHGYLHYPHLSEALNRSSDPYLIAGGNSQALLDFVMPTVGNTSTDDLNFINLRATRDLMTLPGGPLGLALGTDFRRKKLNAPNPGPAQDGTMALPGAFALGSEKNTSVHAEISLPLLKTLELSAAARYDHYDTYGSSSTPKLGFKFTPVKAFALRGTVSRGFRAPSATENGIGGSLFLFNRIRDPQLCPVSLPSGAPDLTAAANVPVYCSFAPVYLQVTSKDVRPEKSRSLTLGLIFEPIAGWSTTLDYYRITVDDQIIPAASLADFDPVAAGVRGTPQQVTFGDGRTGLSPVGPFAYSASPYVNGQRTATSGLEFETRYRFKLAAYGELAAGLQLAHMLRYDQTINGVTARLAGTHGPSIIGGNTGNPRDRAQLSLAWTLGAFSTAATFNRVGSYDVTDPSLGITTCAAGITANNAQFANGGTPPDRYCRVAAFTTTNLSLQYQMGPALTLRGAVLNLFDKAPPVDLNTYGGTGANTSSGGSGAPYNPSLHQSGAVGRFFSAGLDYKF